MTAPGRYAASDGSFAKSTGNAAARGAILIGIAVLIGFLLLAKAFDGGDADAVLPAVDDPAGETPVVDTGETPVVETGETPVVETGETPVVDTPSDTATVVDAPGLVEVAVLNGSGVSGQAGDRAGALGTAGYVNTAGNAASNATEASTVYYKAGYADEAKLVADALAGAAGGAGVIEPAPADVTALADAGDADKVESANIIVVLGTDGVLA
ncbi:MAG: hypothetical protein ACI9C1_001660 [Candidatus Aldehydirespiratoraceae bacterium]|jgi:hypothetical protein